MDFLTILQILDSTVRLATPLLLACLAGLYSERAGIFDIGLEGKILAAAFFSQLTFWVNNVLFGLSTCNFWKHDFESPLAFFFDLIRLSQPR